MYKKQKRFDNAMTLIISILIIITLSIVFTSCGTQRGGCGGNPIHLGN
jgi:hypothetical protein